MTENAKKSTAQSTIQDPPEYNAENATSSKEASQSTEGAYQQNGQSWLGGPQNGSETSSSDQDGSPEPSSQDYTKHRFSDASTKEDKAWTGSGKA
ncbi:MAG: hypothetical protein JF584_18880 [Acidobacteria bacterium]|nr:hypothetical protein [Acidobacteriota bacterium]